MIFWWLGNKLASKTMFRPTQYRSHIHSIVNINTQKFIRSLSTTIVHDRKSAEKVINVLYKLKDRYHAWDTETMHIDVKKQSPVGHGVVLCASLYCGDDVDFGNGPRVFIDNLDGELNSELIMLFREYFENQMYRKVWHNYGFDRHILYNHGINVLGFGGDTMHMARLWDSSRIPGSYSLESLTSDLLGDEFRKRPMTERFSVPNVKQDGTESKLKTLPPLDELQRSLTTRNDWIDYSTYDAKATYHLMLNLRAKLAELPWAQEKSMLDFYDMYWRPFGECLTDMERAGIYVRAKDYLPHIQKVAEADRDAAAAGFMKWARSYCGDAVYMNLSSDAQKQQFFFAPYRTKNGKELLPSERTFLTLNEEGYIEPGKTRPKKNRPFVLRGLGMPVETLSKTRMPSVSLPVLRALAGTDLDSDIPQWGAAYKFFGGGAKGEQACRAISQLCQMSAIDTLLSTFIEPLQDDVDSSSRIHCSMNLNTETGRLSARRPNLQNQPALEKDLYKIRDAFACEPGTDTTFIVADYGQLELRVLAHMSNCRSMIDAFKQGGDFHSRTAIGMYPHVRQAVERKEVLLEWDSKDGEAPAPLLKNVFTAERRRAKTLNFSIAYGKTAHGLAKDWNVSLDEAKKTLEAWYSDRPEVREWQRSVIETAKQDGATYTLMGRRRMLPDINARQRHLVEHAKRAAINTPIQGGAADVVMKAMLNLHANQRFRDIGWKMLLQVHDEIIAEGPQDTQEEAMQLLRECMERPFVQPLLVDLVVDACAETTWYAAK